MSAYFFCFENIYVNSIIRYMELPGAKNVLFKAMNWLISFYEGITDVVDQKGHGE